MASRNNIAMKQWGSWQLLKVENKNIVNTGLHFISLINEHTMYCTCLCVQK